MTLPPRRQNASFASCEISMSALPSGSVFPLVRTVAARDPRGFMWRGPLWLAGKHTGSTLLRLRWRMPESCLALFRRAQLGIDTTMVSPIRRDGTARRQCASTNGAACRQEGAKRGRTLSSLGPWGGPDWWCSVARWGEGGLRRPAVS